MDKKAIKFDDTEIEEHKFQQYLISFLLINKNLNRSFVTKILKKLDLYAYFVHRGLYIKDILMKIDAFIS